MTEFSIATAGWDEDIANGDPDVVCRTNLRLAVAERNLTRNVSLWTRAVEDQVRLSVHPLAEWFIHSWWRLLCEPAPYRTRPTADWRMAHDLAAAGGGYVWPGIRFASDGKSMKVTARLFHDPEPQSVRYIEELDEASIDLPIFENEVTRFLRTVVDRVVDVGCESALPDMWKQLQEELADPESSQWRRIEAELGFDPDDAPRREVEMAILVEKALGKATASEVIPAFGQQGRGVHMARCQDIIDSPGIEGTPQPIDDETSSARCDDDDQPWKRAYQDARRLRTGLKDPEHPLDDAVLCELLGMSPQAFEGFESMPGSPMGLAVAVEGDRYVFHPRKSRRFSESRRYELARFIGDFASVGRSDGCSLASTDFRTARQAYQRAFAAEFLCPSDGLSAVIKGYRGEEAREVAAAHYGVSQRVVEHQIANNRPPFRRRRRF